MKIASWNVNSLNVRLPQVLAWLEKESPDVLCLQETKMVDEKFPREAIEAAGYQVVFTGQKTFNGVATLAKTELVDVVTALPGFDDVQKRFLATTVGGVRVVNVYVPNGSEVGSDKYAYKLSWLKALGSFLEKELRSHSKLLILGDFNIAPYDADVYDPNKWKDVVLVSGPERDALYGLFALGLKDSFRLFEQPPEVYSWWDYRTRAFSGNRGLRIDLILVSEALVDVCEKAWVDIEPRTHERPSDHAPVILTC